MTDVDARADLSRLKLPELQALAAERGIAGASKLRKGELVDALSADDTQTSAADFAAPIDEVSADASTGTVDDLAPESAGDGEGVDVSTPSDDTVPVRRSRRVTASSADAAALAAAPASQHVAAADVAADLDKLLPEVTSGAADGDGEEGGSSRSRGRNRNRGGGQGNAQNAGGQNNGGQNGQNAGRQQGGQGQNGGGQNNGAQQNGQNGPQNNGQQNNGQQNNG
ncbi:MAG: Rho termination factor N-terminal domain-containing protein, partial [Leifsonia sp.]|nr:Rho termination factor N-terminal domain-containing protein [Leifsonia sp.]